MVTTNITTHIPEDASPDKLLPLLVQMRSDNISFPSLSEFKDYADEYGFGRRPELSSFAKLCGFLHQDDTGLVQLTEEGCVLADLRPEVRSDIAHHRIYTIYDPDQPGIRTESWAYRQVVDGFWQRAPVNVLSAHDAVVEEASNTALELFGASISFSTKSVRGVRKWLEALSPPVLEENVLTRRSFCHPELTLLATAWVCQRSDADLGIDLLLTPARREAICRLCLLEPAALDRTLDWMLPSFAHIVVPGTTAGAYGRFLRFLKWPTLADLLRP